MKILVCGGRDFGNIKDKTRPDYGMKVKEYFFVQTTLHNLACEYSQYYNPNDNWLPGDIEIISGMANGADTVAVDWAVTNWVKVHEFPADWKRYGKSAGFIRNKQMLEEGQPDLVVAFPGGKGTSGMIKLAKSNNVLVRTFYPTEAP